ncbi:MAG: NAD/NADP octopine/nopaline dehydrogenase family protein, partial [Spirochaetales bacterium]|nr:NAD/NADP octopine/nopaline dehydrogenase family protein [Spirochaetales bacterium]
MRKKRYTVIGAGNGGLITAGYIFLKGYEVFLYNRSEERIQYIKDHDYTIQFGDKSDKIRLNYVGTNLSVAVSDSDVIIIVITANGHSDIAEKIAPYLKDGQIILLAPGRTCGVLLFNETLNKAGCRANVIVAEANTLFFAARLKNPGLIEIKGIKNEVPVAALYSGDTDYVIDVLSDIFTNIIKADSFLETSFSNIGAIFHPVISLLNIDRILRKEIFNFYTDGVTKKVAHYIEKVDFEFESIAAAIGINKLSVVDWLNSRYGLPKTSIYKMIKSNPTYKDILAPSTINHRYIWEDIPTGLVPMSLFGKNLGIPTPTIDYFVDEGSKLLNIDFRSEGRTLRKLGLSSDNL